MKSLLLGMALFSLQAIATASDTNYSSNNELQPPPSSKDWHQVLIEKEGCCVEGGGG